jgi:hypothetical protein
MLAPLDTEVALQANFTLGTEPGSINETSPVTWTAEPAGNAVLVGGILTAVVTFSAFPTTISVTANANLNDGVIVPLTISGTFEPSVLVGADGGTITIA